MPNYALPALTRLTQAPSKTTAQSFIVPVRPDVDTGTLRCPLLKSLDPHGPAERNALIIPNPSDFLSRLRDPRVNEIRRQFAQFNDELSRHAQSWNFRSVPTLKRVLRLWPDGSVLGNLPLLPVAHHFGAVPALAIATLDN